MRRLLFSLSLLAAAAVTTQAADYERSNWRHQLYLQAEPAFLNFKGSVSDDRIEMDDINKDVFTAPISAGFLWSPLITPFWKADIPFTIWLGLEVNSIQFGTIEDSPKYELKGSTSSVRRDEEELSFLTYAPSVLAGFTFNVVGGLDIRALGGFGFHFFSFYDYYNTNTVQYSDYVYTAFVSGALEYRITEVFQDVDLKIGLNVRKEFLAYEDIKARNRSGSDEKVPSPYSGLTFDKIEYKWPVRVGLELSLDFGRESRRDRKMRFKLHDRDAVLRENSEVKDTLSDWDCMAIERDYRFYLDEDGNLPDMSEAFTRTQFADVLESYLAFCHPADLATKELLYASLDSGKVEIKEYQVKQEDSRFDQVMASNDPEMLEMFLQYYPDSPRRAEVENKLRSLGEYDKFRVIQAQNTFKAYLSYLNDNPNGAFRDEAEAGIFELVKASNRTKDYEIYLKRFPNGRYVDEAKAALAAASQENSIIEYQTGETYDTTPEEQPAEEVSEEPAEEEEEEEVAPAKKGKKAKAAKKAKKPAKKAKKAAKKPAKKKKK
ncbi:MAG: hypothetical protein MJY93_09590 [Fibrobacter sp.]|nr:hypothetical protein [Fibrobacter sp.]